jgi:hypothetical protein
MPLLMRAFRFPPGLSSKDLLVAEAVQAQAWQVINCDGSLTRDQAMTAQARLGAIVFRLIAGGSKSIGDLTAEAIRSFRNDITDR